MNEEMYSDMALESEIQRCFGVKLEIEQVIAGHVPVSRTTTATVFLTAKKQLYVYINGQSNIQLGDVKKIISRMGLVAEMFFPPKGQPQYFDEVGRQKFKEIFPGHSSPTNEDLAYYRTLASYRPALVQVLEVKNGEIYQFDTDSHNTWRVGVRFAYRRIKTS